ncbi:MAG: UDP-glucose 4-epimerase GalE [Oscillospiraceae bacterium]|nr:UDP-glucose 4-epimerase GalE [Oscillospiraceae bacterium]
MRVLVTGGAGYIGSNTCVELLHAGHHVIIADDLSNSDMYAVHSIKEITGKSPACYRIDVSDAAALKAVFEKEQPEAVIHFAGFKAVAESCREPLRYYRNNLDATLTLLEMMREFGCHNLVFSSSATVYGAENPYPYLESMPLGTAFSPYGTTKIMIERILTDCAAADPEFSAVMLRYFNPIGAHASGYLGDDPSGIPNNLMPYLVRTAAGELEKLTVFGNDYPTPDGTCRRDYLHVTDLARGHLCALEYAAAHTGTEAVNLGTGMPVSVLELVKTFCAVNGIDVPYVFGDRRAGDLPEYWANAEKAERLFGWRAEKTLADMCRDSWNFARRTKKERENDAG